jgi:hypothetical protein
MTVSVVIGFNSYNQDIVNKYENADELAVSDGHLEVQQADGSTVAWYAPGKWYSAYVGDAPKS